MRRHVHRLRLMRRNRVSGQRRASGVTAASFADSFKYCREEVSKRDLPHFGCSLLVVHRRDAFVPLVAYRALNLETVHVLESVKEASIRESRLQWWKDAVLSVLKSPDATVPQHPVLQVLAASTWNTFPTTDAPSPLSATSSASDASSPSLIALRSHLTKFLNARIAESVRGSFVSMQDLEDHGEAVASSLLYAGLNALGASTTEADHAASHLGKAATICNVLRGVAHHAAQRVCLLPVQVLAKHGCVTEELFRGESSSALTDALFDVASVASIHLDYCDTILADLPNRKSCDAVVLNSVFVRRQLEAFQRAAFNPFDPHFAAVSPLWDHVRMLRAHWFGVRKPAGMQSHTIHDHEQERSLK